MPNLAFIINPGSGDARGYGHACLRDAWKNIRRFRRDLNARHVRIVRVSGGDEEGRYLFRLERIEGRRRLVCDVLMPGLRLEAVRYRENTADNAWHFPRLLTGPYGSSWLWPFALCDVATDLHLPDEAVIR